MVVPLGVQSAGKIGVGFMIDTDFFENFFDSEGNLFFFFFCILEYPIFSHLRCNAPWQRQPRANWKTYLTIRYDINVSFKGTMHFVNLFLFRNFLPSKIPFSLDGVIPNNCTQNCRGSTRGKAYDKICFSLQNIVITFKNTLKWFYVNILYNLWYKIT